MPLKQHFCLAFFLLRIDILKVADMLVELADICMKVADILPELADIC
ncbi:hypothetical protein [Bacillus benzoevorans]